MDANEARTRELLALKTIAETLNEATDLEPMLQGVLPKVLEALGFTTGWIFLTGPGPRAYRLIADHGLPPALCRDAKRPMSRGGCWCLDAYWGGGLERAANTMECKRLDEARRRQWGETHQISHHATVPLASGSVRFGLLNVAHPEKRHFSPQELALLESVALQIGTAIARVRLLQAQRDQARLEERNRLARDLHDSISQSLFSLNLLAQGARKLIHRDPEEAARALEEIQALAQESLQAMRSLIWQLRPEGLEQGLITALTQYGARLGLTVEVAVTGGGAVPQAVEEALWRIGQEALNNVRRHAGVDQVQVEYGLDREMVTLTVRDRGVGFQARAAGASGGFGLIGMRERAQSLGGDVTVRSRRGGGTEVRAIIPLPAASEGGGEAP
ncbi:histidine kinase [Limnochorda sp.]|uniref:GAF domain-containing sensor histidine kinase n=1 Tax=Limnochorda sp. TaxID=1940279 RepID=UPI001DCDF58D|nr:histidine kinase [Bacillota bacterium]